LITANFKEELPQLSSYIVKEIINSIKGLPEQFIAVGHRVVHGGEKFTQSVIINETVLEGIKNCISLAPLHNPAALLGITAAQKAFPALPQIAVFDTAFHQTMPAKAFMYALPQSLYKEHAVRRYGMHGTSASGVMPMLVSTLLPFFTAVTDPPLPKCAVITFVSSMGLFNALAASLVTNKWLVPCIP
jgi:acetate kinase